MRKTQNIRGMRPLAAVEDFVSVEVATRREFNPQFVPTKRACGLQPVAASEPTNPVSLAGQVLIY